MDAFEYWIFVFGERTEEEVVAEFDLDDKPLEYIEEFVDTCNRGALEQINDAVSAEEARTVCEKLFDRTCEAIHAAVIERSKR